MERATVNGATIEYEVTGSGEPVLCISPVLADGFQPLLQEPALAGHQLIHYHRRGWVGSTHSPGPVPIGVHVDDAIALLDHLEVDRAHLVGHSSGAAVATQMALDAPDRVSTVTLLELSLMTLPQGQAFLQGAGPVLEAYQAGEHEAAFGAFMSAVSGLDWPACRALFAERVPGLTEQSVKDADTFFGIELPSLIEWSLTAEDAGRLQHPVLAVLGTETLPLWVEVTEYLRSTVPNLTVSTVDGVGHLLHIQRAEPVAAAIAQFLGAHALTGA